MASNRDRAAEVLAQDRCWIPGPGGMERFSVAEGADALDDAGVLAPDLPTPNRQGRWKVTAASFGSVATSPAGEVVLDAGNFRDMQLYLNPDKARVLALALLAAADHAQKEENNE